MTTLRLDSVDVNGLGGTLSVAVGVGASVSDPISLDIEGLPRRDNKERTLAIKITRHTLTGGLFGIRGRVDKNDDDGWADATQVDSGSAASLLTSPPWSIEDGDGVLPPYIYRLPCDFQEIQIVTDATTGTMDVDLAIGA